MSIEAIERALTHPDVIASITPDAEGRPKIFGLDNRPVDGSLEKLTVGNQTVLVGPACNGRMNFGDRPCIDPPAALVAAIELLRQAEDELTAEPDCQAIQP